MASALLLLMTLFADVSAEHPLSGPRPLRGETPSCSDCRPQVAAPRAARVETSPPPTPAATTATSNVQRRWYGWQLLLMDAAAVTLLVRGDIPPFGPLLGGGMLVLGAPALHFANGNDTGALVSLGVRGGAALAIGLIFSTSQESCPSNDPLCPAGQVSDAFLKAGAALTLVLGALIFTVVDDLALSRVDVPSAAPTARSHRRGTALALSPFAAPRPGGLSFGLGATF